MTLALAYTLIDGGELSIPISSLSSFACDMIVLSNLLHLGEHETGNSIACSWQEVADRQAE